MLPEPRKTEAVVEKAQHREGIEQLRLPLIHQVAAVGIKNNAVALEHIHHLKQVIRSVGQKRHIAEEALDQLLTIGRSLKRGRELELGHQVKPPGNAVRASWLSPVVAASLMPTRRSGANPSTNTPRLSRIAGICSARGTGNRMRGLG